MHIDVSRASEASADTTPSRGQNGHRCWEDWIDEEEHVRYEACSQQLGARLARACPEMGFQLGFSSKNLFHHKENRVSGLTHGDDFVLTGPTKRLTEFENEMTSVYPIKAKIISLGSPKSIKTLNRRLHWGKE